MPDQPRNPDPNAPDGAPPPRAFGRRSFFRSGFRELLRPLVESVDERIAEIANVLPSAARGSLDTTVRATSLHVLRPPGAIAEAAFLDACSSCGVCVSACPADAIKIDATRTIGGGRPYIDADVSPCVVSSSLDCMMFCPTGALVPTPIRLIDMGTARWNASTCVRTRGDACTICVDECPIGEVAIRLDETGRVQVIEDGCVGCGLCQNRCPTTPKSIVVEPKAARED